MARLIGLGAGLLAAFAVVFVVVLSGVAPAGAAGERASSTAGVVAGIQPGDPLEGCPHPPVTQPYGPTDFAGEPTLRGFAHYHTGIDLACPFGTPVRDVGGAGLAHVQFGSTGFGNNVVVEVRTVEATWFVRYAHLAAIAVPDGAAVGIGDLVGWEGSTGFSTGPHLHFETDRGSPVIASAVDPSGWLAL